VSSGGPKSGIRSFYQIVDQAGMCCEEVIRQASGLLQTIAALLFAGACGVLALPRDRGMEQVAVGVACASRVQRVHTCAGAKWTMCCMMR
jgi:hypothetical protein